MYMTTLTGRTPPMANPTEQAYRELQQAYDVFNRRLFAGQLPPCLITMQRKNRTYGYFSGDRWNDLAGAMTHYVIEDGPFAQVSTALLGRGLSFPGAIGHRTWSLGKAQGNQACGRNTPVPPVASTPGQNRTPCCAAARVRSCWSPTRTEP